MREQDPAAAETALATGQQAAPETAMLLAAGLTPEDIEALHHAAAGKTNAQIAKIMYLSVPTIERRFTHMYRRLGVRNRAQAVNLISQYLVR